jgi:hypothetical protein
MWIVAVASIATGCRTAEPRNGTGAIALARVEANAIHFLQREVPRWSRDNGCFSCHNNGDAARALFRAREAGHRVPSQALAETVHWIMRPEVWSDNKGDPGFSDQRLADIQFAASLRALRPRTPESHAALRTAALRIAAAQDPDGSWRIEPQNAVGSPATYGTALATFMAWTTLRASEANEVSAAREKASAWLQALQPVNVPSMAVIILAALERGEGRDSSSVRSAMSLLVGAQTSEGGWGPYADAPAEVFDSSLALLALSGVEGGLDQKEVIERGRRFLQRTQLADGSWPATTRPSGGASYAQRMSTTGWATLALLATR